MLAQMNYLIVRTHENGEVSLQYAATLRDLETLANEDPNPNNPTVSIQRYTLLP